MNLASFLIQLLVGNWMLCLFSIYLWLVTAVWWPYYPIILYKVRYSIYLFGNGIILKPLQVIKFSYILALYQYSVCLLELPNHCSCWITSWNSLNVLISEGRITYWEVILWDDCVIRYNACPWWFWSTINYRMDMSM